MIGNKQLSYEDIFKKLQEREVKYLLIGGIAVNLYGVQRATADIDLVLSMNEENLSKIIALTKELGLKPKMPIKAETLKDPARLKQLRQEKNMRAFSFDHPDDPSIVIDVMVEDLLPFEAAYQRRKIMRAWGISVSTVSLEDLIGIKQASGRDQDLADVEALSKFRGV